MGYNESMAERSALTYLVKWILLPAAIGAAGYYFVGPRIGGVAPRTADASDSVPATATESSSPAPAEVHDYPAPDVTVSVDSNLANRTASLTRKPRQKPKKKTRPVHHVDTKVAPDPQPDVDPAPPGAAGDGGSAGGTGVPPPDDGSNAGAGGL